MRNKKGDPMSGSGQTIPQNLLLRTLTADDWRLIEPALKPVDLRARAVLSEPSAPITHVDFVESGIVSVVGFAGEREIEVALIGPEGMTGVPILHGMQAAPHLVNVQVSGSALRIEVEDLRAVIEWSSSLRGMLLRYAHVLQVQMAHAAVVNGHYSIHQRLARWILMCHDRTGADLPLTHDFIAVMLGIRRSGVTDAIHVLEGEQMIRATRARIIVRDRERLIAKAAGSYGLPEAEYEKAFGKSVRQKHASKPILTSKRILIVEDEYELATEMQAEFASQGAMVVGPVPSVKEALSLMIATPAIDGAVIDINLGGEMAFPLAEVLRKRNVPFVFVSGYSHSIVPNEFLDIKFYSKPVEIDDIAVALLAS